MISGASKYLPFLFVLKELRLLEVLANDHVADCQ